MPAAPDRSRPTPARPAANPPARSPRASQRDGLHSPADWLRWFGRTGKRLLVLAVGVAIVGAGVAMLALPGPGLLVIIVGLAVLATEFAWAERALDRTTDTAATAASKVSNSRSGRLALAASGLGMIVGGAIAASVVDGLRIVGISIAVAGLVGLATLLPSVQRWLDSRTSTVPRDAAGRDTPDHGSTGLVPVASPVTQPLTTQNGDTP